MDARTLGALHPRERSTHESVMVCPARAQATRGFLAMPSPAGYSISGVRPQERGQRHRIARRLHALECQEICGGEFSEILVHQAHGHRALSDRNGQPFG
jgi:hypothetical protein